MKLSERSVKRECKVCRVQPLHYTNSQVCLDFIELFGLKREGGRVRLMDDSRKASDDDGFIVPDDEDDELDWLPIKSRGKGKKRAASVESE